jgi:hypothetical protein
MTDNPHVGVVVDLVDPYLTAEVKNSGGFRSTSPGGNLAIWWMRRHPGRWALVGEGRVGLSQQLLQDCKDIQVSDPKGETLHFALRRRTVNTPELYLPDLVMDDFGWTKAELADACEVARANLFPTGAP